MQREKKGKIITSAFDKILVQPLAKFIPASLSPVPLVIVSVMMFYAAFYISVNDNFSSEFSFLIPLFLFLYVVMGRLAVYSTKQEVSKISELLSDGINSINYGLLGFIIYQQFESNQFVLLGVLLLTAYTLGAFYFYHQFKVNRLPLISACWTDIVLITLCLLFLLQVDPVRQILTSSFLEGYFLIDLFILIVIGVLLWLFIKILREIPHVTYGIWLFIAGLILIVGFGIQLFTPMELAISVALYGGWYICKIKVAVLVDGVERSTGLFTPIIVVLSYFMESLSAYNTFLIITFYMLLNMALLFYKSIKSLKQQD